MNTFSNNHIIINHNISDKMNQGQINNIYRRINNDLNEN